MQHRRTSGHLEFSVLDLVKTILASPGQVPAKRGSPAMQKWLDWGEELQSPPPIARGEQVGLLHA
jgi:hypothetical protein